MAYNVATLVSALSESRRFASFASDTFRLLPARNLVVSQHDDCLFAVPYPRSDGTEGLLLSDEFGQGEGKEVARDYFQRLSITDRSAVCLLDANEENLYNEPTRGTNCIYVAGGVAAYAVNNAGDVLAVALCNGILTFYEIASRGPAISLKANRELKTNTKNVTQICFDSSDAYTACGAVDGAVAVYHEGVLLKVFHHQQGQISVLRFFPNSLRLLAGTQSGDIVMYCLKKKAPIATFQDHLSYVNDIAFLVAEDDAQSGFVSCARDSYVCFWALNFKKREIKDAVARGTVLVRKPFKRLMQFESVVGVSIINKGLVYKGTAPWVLFVATESGQLRLIDPITEKVLHSRQMVYGHGDELKSVALCKNANEVVVLGSSGSLGFYSVNLELKHQILGNIDGAFQFQLYQGTNTMDVSELVKTHAESAPDTSTTLSRVETNNVKDSKRAGGRHSVKNGGHHLNDHSDRGEEAMQADSEAEGDGRSHPASPGAHKASKKKDSAAAVRARYQDWIHSLDWLNKQVAKGVPVLFILCGDDAIRLLALDGWGSFVTLGLANDAHRHTDTVLSIAYSAAGGILASGGKDERVFIWDLKTLTVVATISLDGLNVACIALPSGISAECTQFRLVATGNNVMKSFDVPTSWAASSNNLSIAAVANSKPHKVTAAAATVVRHKKPINAVAFSPNKKVIASAGSDKIVVIYAAENLIVKGECLGHRRSVVSVAFTSINKTVVSSSIDMTIKIWNLNDFSCIKTLQVGGRFGGKNVAGAHESGHAGPRTAKRPAIALRRHGRPRENNHSDKVSFLGESYIGPEVWNAEVAGPNVVTISGNGVLIWWDDVSAEIEAKKLLEEREEELKRTQVESLAADGKYSEALCLAMELRRPAMASKILKRRAATQLFRVEKESGVSHDLFTNWVRHLKTAEDPKTMLTIAFDFIHLWVSKGSTSWMGNCLLAELVAQFTPTELFLVEGMAQRIDSILAHQASHLTRVARFALVAVDPAHQHAGESSGRAVQLEDVGNCDGELVAGAVEGHRGHSRGETGGPPEPLATHAVPGAHEPVRAPRDEGAVAGVEVDAVHGEGHVGSLGGLVPVALEGVLLRQRVVRPRKVLPGDAALDRAQREAAVVGKALDGAVLELEHAAARHWVENAGKRTLSAALRETHHVCHRLSVHQLVLHVGWRARGFRRPRRCAAGRAHGALLHDYQNLEAGERERPAHDVLPQLAQAARAAQLLLHHHPGLLQAVLQRQGVVHEVLAGRAYKHLGEQLVAQLQPAHAAAAQGGQLLLVEVRHQRVELHLEAEGVPLRRAEDGAFALGQQRVYAAPGDDPLKLLLVRHVVHAEADLGVPRPVPRGEAQGQKAEVTVLNRQKALHELQGAGQGVEPRGVPPVGPQHSRHGGQEVAARRYAARRQRCGELQDAAHQRLGGEAWHRDRLQILAYALLHDVAALYVVRDQELEPLGPRVPDPDAVLQHAAHEMGVGPLHGHGAGQELQQGPHGDDDELRAEERVEGLRARAHLLQQDAVVADDVVGAVPRLVGVVAVHQALGVDLAPVPAPHHDQEVGVLELGERGKDGRAELARAPVVQQQLVSQPVVGAGAAGGGLDEQRRLEADGAAAPELLGIAARQFDVDVAARQRVVRQVLEEEQRPVARDAAPEKGV
ncbi:transducin-like G-protein beta [Babesia caballi]|uniref:Transducin-like G-protein beta n=1 Tax=Babesia caballi TaxID=5871 RepID=A0AAV4LV13_BABCB|nr:transducin-like G-protein beta [Babesia caballi]